MHQVIVNIDNANNVGLFLQMVQQLKFVETARMEEKDDYDWLNPHRPATDAECKQLIYESEASESMVVEEAKSYSSGIFAKWKSEGSK